MNLQGLRTKISGYLASLLPVAGVLGYEIDPAFVIEVLSNHGMPLACAQALTSLAVHYYRNEAKVDSDFDADEVANVDQSEKVSEPPVLNSLNQVEEQVLTLSNGEFTDD